MGSHLKIHLFGQPEAIDPSGKALPKLTVGKPFAVLAYLLLEGKRTRDEVIGILWGDMDEAKARNAFRQALHRLRTVLGEEALPQNPDFLEIAGAAGIATDVATFEAAVDAGDFDRAIASYRGDFLTGFDVSEPAFDAWVEAKRNRYRTRFRDVLHAAIRINLERGELARALELTKMLGDADASDADGALLHATTLLSAGRRVEALHFLERFEKRHQLDLGGAAPVSIREMAARLRRPSGESATNGPRTREKFVGRDEELTTLLAAMSGLSSGKRSLILLEGESGIGKTRILDEFFTRSKDLGTALLLLGRERAAGSGIPFASIAEALRGTLDAPGLAGTGQHLLAEASRLLPQLRDQFSLPPTSDVADDAGRLRFFEGIAALLDSVAYEQPVCIALDDFHNCSEATFQLVHYLIERLRNAPVLFLLTARRIPEFESRRKELLRLISGDAKPGIITLGSLDKRAARSIVCQFLGAGLDDGRIDQIVEAAGGIPYRISEISQRALAGDSIGGTPVPIRDVLWTRLQRCSQSDQRLFVASALLDRPASIRLLAAAAHLSEKNALDAALTLEREGLLLQRPEGVVPSHDFAGELALEGTGPAGRALLAGWLAEALEHDRSGSAAELANLFTLAGRREKAFEFSRAAAHDAVRAGEFDAAVKHFKIALATAPTERDSAQITAMLRGLEGGLPRLPERTRDALFGGDQETTPPHTSGERVETANAEPEPPAPTPRREAPSKGRIWYGRAAISASLVVLAVVALRGVSSLRASSVPGTSLNDSLLVAEEIDQRDTVIAFTTGALGSPLTLLPGATTHGMTRSWEDSLRLPWINPFPSPDGRYVAVERISKSGSALYVISSDRRDTIPIAPGNADDLASAWSPDGRWLLATHGETRSDGTYDADLYAYSILERGKRIPIDTAAARGVVEAAWSPDGSHIAWTARIGAQHQQDVFVSDADGSHITNLSDDPGEDYSLAWSPDGRALAFTSERTGRAEIFSMELSSHRMRRLTWDGAHADHATFSPDGRWLAYESSQGGNQSVYVMPAGGGTGRSVASPRARVSLLRWRGHPSYYLDRLSIESPELSKIGDSGNIVVRGFDARGDSLSVANVAIRSLDPSLIRIDTTSGSGADPRAKLVRVVALSSGLARVVAASGGWRADTVFLPIGGETLTLLDEKFENGLNRLAWRALGDPLPGVSPGAGNNGSFGLVTHSDREWESGVLTKKVFPVRTGLTATAWVKAPFSDPPTGGKSFVVALVAADPVDAPDSIAPQFLRLASFSWSSVAGRVSYAVGREVFTEPVTRLPASSHHEVTISIGSEGLVIFGVDGIERWKSTLRVRTSGDNSRAQLWLAGQGTGNEVVFDDAAVQLEIRSRSALSNPERR